MSLNRWIFYHAYGLNNPLYYNDPDGHFPVPPFHPNDFIDQAVSFFSNLGYSVVGDPVSKSVNANGADLVFQKLNEANQVIETLCVECKEVTGTVDLGTLGKDKAGNYGGSISRVLNTASRLANTSKAQLQSEFEAIRQGQAANNLKNALYTTANNVSDGAKNVFNYVYTSAASGAATAVKGAQTFLSTTIEIPALIVPYELINPKNSPLYNPAIPQ